MCDQECYNSCSNSFYHHYMNQHAILMQFLRQLHQNTDSSTSYNNCQTCHCGTYPVNTCCSPCSSKNYSSRPDSCSPESANTSVSSEYELEEEDSSEIYEDDDEESECEYEFNVEAILAMRAAKEDLGKSSKSSTSKSESIVLVDSDKEDFEFVELGSQNAILSQLARSVGCNVNKKEEFENRKKAMDYLYGEKSATIGGLETAMAINFERLCDIHQPSLWPVLPVRL